MNRFNRSPDPLDFPPNTGPHPMRIEHASRSVHRVFHSGGARLIAGALAVLLGVSLASSAHAITASYEGFDYATGSLNGRNGGTGDWKDPWSGDSDIRVVSPGFTETDGGGNELTVSGNRVGKTGNAVLKTVRTLNNETGASPETVWASVIIDGDGGNRIHNFSLGDGLFIGQGTKDSSTNRLGMSDQNGLLQNSTITPAGQHFLVLRVDFRSGNEHAWLWIDPSLTSEPSTASANASSTSVTDFKFAFVQIQVQRPNNTGIDEIRLGSSFADVTPPTASAVCGNGTVEPGEQCDDASGCCSAVTCQIEGSGTSCGSAATECSAQDTCDGAGVCVANNLVVGTTCGDAGTQCTNQDTCDGGGACTDNGFAGTGTSCGAAGTECSAQDTCDGAGVCVANNLVVGTACGDAGTQCTNQDTCDGGGACTDNGFAGTGTSCGAAGTECSAQDTCDGAGVCLANNLALGTSCGDTGTECTFQDTCDGGGACTDNGFAGAGTACGSPGDQCNLADTCNGGGACTDNGFAGAGTACGSPGDQCNLADTCNGSGICAVNGPASDGLVCDDGNPGTVNDQCNVGTCSGGAAPSVPMSSSPGRVLLLGLLASLGLLAYGRAAPRT